MIDGRLRMIGGDIGDWCRFGRLLGISRFDRYMGRGCKC